MATKFVIIGGGPAGNTAATHAARLGADVTLIERDIVGGAAHLWDCIPSKALIATGGELVELDRAHAMGLKAEGSLDIDALRERVASIEGRLQDLSRKIFLSGGLFVDVASVRRQRAALESHVQAAKDSVAEIDAIGVQVKDLDTGLLDFPCQLDGNIVLWSALNCGVVIWLVLPQVRSGYWQRTQTA